MFFANSTRRFRSNEYSNIFYMGLLKQIAGGLDLIFVWIIGKVTVYFIIALLTIISWSGAKFIDMCTKDWMCFF